MVFAGLVECAYLYQQEMQVVAILTSICISAWSYVRAMFILLLIFTSMTLLLPIQNTADCIALMYTLDRIAKHTILY